jgi:AcrR family transcriptional regulator
MPTNLKPRGRGRPVRSQQQVEDMRLRIAEHALQLFQKNGYHAISMRQLAQAVGCTVMTLYRYYPRKIDILRDLWAQVFETLFDDLDQEAKRHSDPIQRIEAIALGYVQFWLKNRDHYFLVFMSSEVDQTDVSIFVGDAPVLARFQIFQQGIAETSADVFPEADLKVKSELLLCALNGISHNLITIGAYPWSSPDILVRSAVRSVIGSNL